MLKSVNQTVSNTYQFIVEFRSIRTAATIHGLPRPGQCLFHLPTNAVSSAISFSEQPASCKFITCVTAYTHAIITAYELKSLVRQ